MTRSLGITTVKILSVIDRRVRYGLDIIQRTDMLPGTVYTTLRRLERRGLVAGQWEDAKIAEKERRPRRRYYTLTPAGERALESARHRLDRLVLEMGRDAPSPREAE